NPSLALPIPPFASIEVASAQERQMETAESHASTKRKVEEPQQQAPILSPDDTEAVKIWSVNRKHLLAMVVGIILFGIIIFCGEGLLNIRLTRGSWFYPLTGYLSSIGLWCLLVTLACYFGAKFGPWVGLVIGGIGYFIAAFISYKSGVGASVTFGQYISFYYLMSSSFDTTGYPILTSYFNLSLALIGFVAGLALLKTQGRYNTLRLVAIAEG